MWNMNTFCGCIRNNHDQYAKNNNTVCDVRVLWAAIGSDHSFERKHRALNLYIYWIKLIGNNSRLKFSRWIWDFFMLFSFIFIFVRVGWFIPIYVSIRSVFSLGKPENSFHFVSFDLILFIFFICNIILYYAFLIVITTHSHIHNTDYMRRHTHIHTHTLIRISVVRAALWWLMLLSFSVDHS